MYLKILIWKGVHKLYQTAKGVLGTKKIMNLYSKTILNHSEYATDWIYLPKIQIRMKH